MSLLAFALAGVSLVGLPPSGGFAAKWLLLSAAVATGQWWWAVVIVLGGLLTGAYLVLVLMRALAEPARRSAAPPRPVAAWREAGWPWRSRVLLGLMGLAGRVLPSERRRAGLPEWRDLLAAAPRPLGCCWRALAASRGASCRGCSRSRRCPALAAALLAADAPRLGIGGHPLELLFGLDAPGALLLGVASLLWIAAGAYAGPYLRDGAHAGRFAACWLLPRPAASACSWRPTW